MFKFQHFEMSNQQVETEVVENPILFDATAQRVDTTLPVVEYPSFIKRQPQETGECWVYKTTNKKKPVRGNNINFF